MNLSQSAARRLDLSAAVNSIEDWLLHSDVQIDEGDHRGGIAGWLNQDGRPEFVYPEIVGYYLTAMAWLSSGAASSFHHRHAASRRARRAASWLASSLASQPAPCTRIYLSGQCADWRNSAVFSFDIAMAARGVAVNRQLSRGERRQTLTGLCAIINRISSGANVMRSHDIVAGNTTMPDRWSTRPGPHHLKAAAAVLLLPRRMVGNEMLGVAQRTYDHWAASVQSDAWPCQELHPLLYALEGMLLVTGRAANGDALCVVERLVSRLMELQAPDGTLPETIDGGIVRSDVIAQALRVCLLLRGRQYLTGQVWTDRVDRLTDALLGFVRQDGGVLFSREQSISNTWCAMFALQALYLRARAGKSDAVPATGFELLV